MAPRPSPSLRWRRKLSHSPARLLVLLRWHQVRTWCTEGAHLLLVRSAVGAGCGGWLGLRVGLRCVGAGCGGRLGFFVGRKCAVGEGWGGGVGLAAARDESGIVMTSASVRLRSTVCARRAGARERERVALTA